MPAHNPAFPSDSQPGRQSQEPVGAPGDPAGADLAPASLPRRSFLRLGVVSGAAALLAACAQPPAPTPTAPPPAASTPAVSDTPAPLPTATPTPTAPPTVTSTPEATATPTPEPSRMLTADEQVLLPNGDEQTSLAVTEIEASDSAYIAIQTALTQALSGQPPEKLRIHQFQFGKQSFYWVYYKNTKDSSYHRQVVAVADDAKYTPATFAHLAATDRLFFGDVNAVTVYGLPGDVDELNGLSLHRRGDLWLNHDNQILLPESYLDAHPELTNAYIEAPRPEDDVVKHFLAANGVNLADLTYRFDPAANALELVDQQGSVWLRRYDHAETVDIYDFAKNKWTEKKQEYHTWVMTPGTPLDVAQTWADQEAGFRQISPECDGATAAEMLHLMSLSISQLPDLKCITDVRGVDRWLSEGDGELRIHELEPLTVLTEGVPVWAIRYSGADAVDEEPIFCLPVSLGADTNGLEQRALLKLRPCSQLVDKFKRRDTNWRIGINETEATQELGDKNAAYSIRLWAMYLYNPLPQVSVDLVGTDIAALLNSIFTDQNSFKGSLGGRTFFTKPPTGGGTLNLEMPNLWEYLKGEGSYYESVIGFVKKVINGGVLIGAPQFQSA